MILRKPATLDIVKIASLLSPENTDDQAEIVSLWLQRQQDDSFIDLVAVHKKKILGFFAATIEDSHLSVIWFKTETPEVLTTLWNKVKSTHEFDSAGVVTGDPDLFTAFGFEPVCVTMRYAREAVSTVS